MTGAMMIPSGNFRPTSFGQQQHRIPTGMTPKQQAALWSGPDWPANSSLRGSSAQSLQGLGLGLGTSPFGKSVDMVDMVAQLMEVGGAQTIRAPILAHARQLRGDGHRHICEKI